MFRDVTKEPAPPEMFPLTLLPETLFILLSVTAPLAISSDVTAFSAIFELVMRLFARSLVEIVPFKILLLVTALSANLLLLMADSEITGEVAVLPLPPKSPANLIFPLVLASASGAPEATCASTYVLTAF